MVDTGWCQLNFIKPTNNAFHDDLEEWWWDLQRLDISAKDA